MRVLLVHQYYESKRGAFNVLFGVERALVQAGHTPILFASRTEAALDTPFARYFPEGFNRSEFLRASPVRKLRHAAAGIYSFEARRRLSQLIAETQPEVAIVFKPEHQLTYSVLSELREHRIPTALWLVDYRFWCSEGYFYNPATRAPCFRCAGGAHWRALRDLCAESSKSLTLYEVASHLVSHSLLSLDRLPDLYVVPTDANRDFLVSRVGLPVERVTVLNHPMRTAEFEVTGEPTEGDYVVYGGQLLWDKGIGTLLGAAKLCKSLRFEIYGIDTGGLEKAITQRIAREGLDGRVRLDTQTRFGPKLVERLRGALCVVAPSEWPDTLEYAMLEAMALGKAVVVADRGGNREVVERANGGLVFRGGAADSLAEALEALAKQPKRAHSFGLKGSEWVRANLNEAAFAERLENVLIRLRNNAE